jgi:hypothetical protein
MTLAIWHASDRMHIYMIGSYFLLNFLKPFYSTSDNNYQWL